MTLKTVKVEVKLLGPDSISIVNACVEACLSNYEIDNGVIVPALVKAFTDSTGTVTLNLWPNARGSASSSYSVKATRYAKLLDVVIVVPDVDSSIPIPIEQLINAEPYPTLDASQIALLGVQAAAAAAQQNLDSSVMAAIAQSGVAQAYINSINNVQELRTMFMSYIASHP
jgi:hypothetical protein